MSIGKRIAHNAEAVKGGVRKNLGRLTGRRRPHAEGRGDQVKGTIKRAGAKVKDAVRR